MVAVVITRDDSIDRAINEALHDVAELDSLVRGKLVAVKPNETYPSAEDTSGVTQPDTLRAVLRILKQAEPRELVVTGGAGAAETDEVFRVAGLMDVVELTRLIAVCYQGGASRRTQEAVCWVVCIVGGAEVRLKKRTLPAQETT